MRWIVVHSVAAVMLLVEVLSPGVAFEVNGGNQGGQAEQGEGRAATARPLMSILADELDYSVQNLVAGDGVRPYYLSYAVYEEHTIILAATLGAITRNDRNDERNLNIDLRVGDYTLDNTHQLRGGGAARSGGSGNISIALEDDEDSIRHALWYHTDRVFKHAAKRLAQIKTNLKVKVEEEDKSDDFSREEAQVCFEPPAMPIFDRDGWADRLRRISAIARDYPLIYSSRVTVGTYAGTRYLATSEACVDSHP